KTYRDESVFEAEVLVKMRNRMKQRAELYEMLTEREMEILLLIAKGYSNQEIASASHITIKTVKTHDRNVLINLKVQDRNKDKIKLNNVFLFFIFLNLYIKKIKSFLLHRYFFLLQVDQW